jgi:hypothetical protein
MSDRLNPGQELPIGAELQSNNNNYRFVMQHDGNLVLYEKGGKALWSSETNNIAIQRCIMQTDGNLVLYRYDGKAVWSSKTDGKPNSFLIVQDDGNVVIYYDPKPQAVWATGTNR